MRIHHVLFLPVLAAACLAGCAGDNGQERFGLFGHNGVYLTEHAVSRISLYEAKTLIGEEDSLRLKSRYNETSSIDYENETIRSILTRFASVKTTVRYFVSGEDKQQVKEDMYQGTEFLYLLKNNSYSPFAQMAVKYIYLNSSILDELEAENKAYKENLANLITPYDCPYTYHRDARGEFVLQTHYFAELPSVINGGIGSTFQQDCELKYDAEGKAEKWQSSLGLYTSTPTGTSLEGYIFEADFEWVMK